MIAYIDGKLTYKSPTHVHMDIGGLAYEIQISLNTYASIEAMDAVKLFTHLIVRDDAHILFGFFDQKEKDLFAHLISVSGIGPNTARVILSYMTPKEAIGAIISDNVAAFKKVKGVGPKTAQRIIIDLKDKLAKINADMDEVISMPGIQPSVREEAISALVALGFQKSAVSKQIDKLMTEDSEDLQLEALIKSVLRQLS